MCVSSARLVPFFLALRFSALSVCLSLSVSVCLCLSVLLSGAAWALSLTCHAPGAAWIGARASRTSPQCPSLLRNPSPSCLGRHRPSVPTRVRREARLTEGPRPSCLSQGYRACRCGCAGVHVCGRRRVCACVFFVDMCVCERVCERESPFGVHVRACAHVRASWCACSTSPCAGVLCALRLPAPRGALLRSPYFRGRRGGEGTSVSHYTHE